MPEPRSNGEVRRLPDRENERIAASIARLEATIGGMREDVSEIKGSVQAFDHRVSMLEDVRVRALEDWRTRQKAISDERARAADRAAARAERAEAVAVKHSEQRLTKLQFYIGTSVVAVVTILGSLIASGRLF